MKLLLKNNVIAGTATDEYTGPMEYITAPDDFDASRMADYQVIDGVLVKQMPDTITPRQCRLQLLTEDKLATVQAAIDTMGEAAKIEWEYALEIKRNYSLVLAMMQLFQWSEADADVFFVEADKL